MTAKLAVDALANAVALRRPVATTVHSDRAFRPCIPTVHSDRGSQFRAHSYSASCAATACTDRCVEWGACADNAAIESFFSLLQKNVLNRRRWQTRHELRQAIVTWIERTHHRRRRQDGLAGSHLWYETMLQTATAA